MALTASSILHHWDARRGATPVYGGRPVATRSSSARIEDQRGVVHAPIINTPRIGWNTIDSERRPTMLLERAGTNLVTYSEDFSLWSGDAPATLTSGQPDPFGGTAAYKVDDSASATIRDIFLAVTLPGTAAVSVFIKKGSGSQAQVKLRDVTAAADRLLANVTWSGNTPVVAMTTGTLQQQSGLAGDWWRLEFLTSAVTAANTHRIYLYPAALNAAETGHAFFTGVQTEDGDFSSSYIKTTGSSATRAVDSFYWDYAPFPQEMFAYVRFVEDGTIKMDGKGVLWFGDATTVPTAGLYNAGGFYRAYQQTSAGNRLSTLAAAPAIGDTVELYMDLESDGKITVVQSVNGAAVTSGAQSTALALGTAWSSNKLYLNYQGTSSIGCNRFAEVKVVKRADVVGATAQARMTELRAFEVNAAGEVLA